MIVVAQKNKRLILISYDIQTATDSVESVEMPSGEHLAALGIIDNKVVLTWRTLGNDTKLYWKYLKPYSGPAILINIEAVSQAPPLFSSQDGLYICFINQGKTLTWEKGTINESESIWTVPWNTGIQSTLPTSRWIRRKGMTGNPLLVCYNKNNKLHINESFDDGVTWKPKKIQAILQISVLLCAKILSTIRYILFIATLTLHSNQEPK